MPETHPDACRDELLQSIEYAVKYSTAGKATNAARDLAAASLAGRVLEHLERCGYVIKKRPPMKEPATP